MSRESRWLDESTGHVCGQLVRAARESEPDPAARERLSALLQRRHGAVPGRRARPATRLISSVLGWAASAAATAPAVGKGVTIGATLSAIKWAGVGAIVGLSSVGVASRAGLIGRPSTPPISVEAPFGPEGIAPKAPPSSPGPRRPPPGSGSDSPELATAPAVASAVLAPPPENPRVGPIAEPMLPPARPSVANPVAARSPNSIGTTDPFVPASAEPADTARTIAAPAPTVAAPAPLPTPAAPAGTTLAAEVATLDAARDRLRAGDAVGALEVLQDYRQRFPRGALADEASLVGITAWLAMGRRDAASGEAERLLARRPPPALEERIRKLMSVR